MLLIWLAGTLVFSVDSKTVLTKNPLPKNACFNHYRPARYFSANVKSLAKHLGDEDVGRFEAVFRAVNELL